MRRGKVQGDHVEQTMARHLRHRKVCRAFLQISVMGWVTAVLSIVRDSRRRARAYSDDRVRCRPNVLVGEFSCLLRSEMASLPPFWYGRSVSRRSLQGSAKRVETRPIVCRSIPALPLGEPAAN